MSLVKESELQLAIQRNDRLRHIQSEMNKLEELKKSGVYHERDIIDPEFSPDETPASIVKVSAVDNKTTTNALMDVLINRVLNWKFV